MSTIRKNLTANMLEDIYKEYEYIYTDTMTTKEKKVFVKDIFKEFKSREKIDIFTELFVEDIKKEWNKSIKKLEKYLLNNLCQTDIIKSNFFNLSNIKIVLSKNEDTDIFKNTLNATINISILGLLDEKEDKNNFSENFDGNILNLSNDDLVNLYLTFVDKIIRKKIVKKNTVSVFIEGNKKYVSFDYIFNIPMIYLKRKEINLRIKDIFNKKIR